MGHASQIIFSFCELLCAPLHSLDRAYMADLGDDDKIMGQEEEIVLTRERPRDAVLRFAKPSTGEETSGNSFFPRAEFGFGFGERMLFSDVSS